MSLALIAVPVGNWVRNANQTGPMDHVLADPAHAGHVYAVSDDTSSVFQSSDSGGTWSLLPRVPYQLTGIDSVAVSATGALFLVPSDDNTYVMIWNGQTWNPVHIGVDDVLSLVSTANGIYVPTDKNIRELRDDGSVGAVYSAPHSLVDIGLAWDNGILLAATPSYGIESFSVPGTSPQSPGAPPVDDAAGLTLGGATTLLIDPVSHTQYVYSATAGAMFVRKSGEAAFKKLAIAAVKPGPARMGSDGTVYVLANGYSADGMNDDYKNDIVKLVNDAWVVAGASSAYLTDAISDFAVAPNGTIILATTQGIETTAGLNTTVFTSGPFVGPTGTVSADVRTFPESLLLTNGTTAWTSSDGFAPIKEQAATATPLTWSTQDPTTHVGFGALNGGTAILYHSSNGGWVADDATGLTGYVNSAHAVVDGSSNIYAYGAAGIYKSQRAANGTCVPLASVCWNKVNDQGTQKMAVDGGTLFAAFGPIVATSNDAGATWKTLSTSAYHALNGIALGGAVDEIAIDPATHRPWIAVSSNVLALDPNGIWIPKTTVGGDALLSSRLFVDTGTSPTTIYALQDTQLIAAHDSLAATQILFPHSAGQVEFNAATRVFYATFSSLAYAYALPTTPTITALDVKSGPTAGGTAVKVSGTNFVAGTTQIFFGTQNAPGTVVSATEFDVTSPAASAGPVDVTVSNGGAQEATLPAAFTYSAPPVAAAPAPTTAPAAATTSVVRDSGCSSSGSPVWAVPALLAFGASFAQRRRRAFSANSANASDSRAAHASISSKGNGMRMKGLLVGALLALAACHGKGYYFTGRVYDGVTRQPLTGYKIQLQYKQSTVNGSVAKDGTYYVGPLPALTDYSVAISATGYRAFLSVNVMRNSTGSCTALDDCTTQDENYYYDAYVFPTALQTPAQTITVYQTDNAGVPATGMMRFIPNNAVNVPASSLENSEAVAIDQWQNTSDAQFGTVTAPIANGVVQLAAGALVYGASYNVTVYGVPGYAIDANTSFTAGSDGDVSVNLNPSQSTGNLYYTFISNRAPTAAGSATITFVFSQPITLASDSTQSFYDDKVSNGSSFTSADANKDGIQNVAVTPAATSTLNEFGIDVKVSGNALTITSSLPASAFAQKDAGTPPDPINTFTFGNLGSIKIVSTANPSVGIALTAIRDATNAAASAIPAAEPVIVTAAAIP